MKARPTTRTWYKWLSMASLAAFVIGIALVLNFLIGFQNELSDKLSLSTSAHINALKPLMTEMFLLIGLAFLFALLALLFTVLYYAEAGKVRQIIYVETEKEAETSDSAQKATEQIRQSIADTVESKLKEISTKLADTKGHVGLSELEKLMIVLCESIDAAQGALFVAQNQSSIHLVTGYAYFATEKRKVAYEWGEGLTGQVAKEGHRLNMKSVPEGYVTVLSGLGKASPKYMIIVPLKDANNNVKAVLEIASFSEFGEIQEKIIDNTASYFIEAIDRNYQTIAAEF